MLAEITVKEYMGRNKVSFSPDMDIQRAIHLLISHQISGAPVVDEHGNLVGFLSEKDCMSVALDAGYYGEVRGNVSDYMATNVKTVDIDTSIVQMAEFFKASAFRRYPVVSGDRVVGAISRRDVLRALEVLAAPEHRVK